MFTASGLASFQVGWFTLGTIQRTSGANTGRRAEIIAHDVTDGGLRIAGHPDSAGSLLCGSGRADAVRKTAAQHILIDDLRRTEHSAIEVWIDEVQITHA